MKTYTEGEILKVLRERFTPPRGTTQEQVAKELGFTRQHIFGVLCGSSPISERLASVLGFREQPRRFVKKLPE